MNKIKNKLIAYIEVLRPGWWPTCFFIGVTPGILAIFWSSGSLDEFIHIKAAIWALAYWVTVVGIYVFNDVVGIEEDNVINPKRPLDYQYQFNFDNYISPELGQEAYESQLVEAEARAFAAQFKDRIGLTNGRGN